MTRCIMSTSSILRRFHIKIASSPVSPGPTRVVSSNCVSLPQFSLNSNRTMSNETSPLLGTVSGDETGASHISHNGTRGAEIDSPNTGLPESSKPATISYFSFVSLSLSSLTVSSVTPLLLCSLIVLNQITNRFPGRSNGNWNIPWCDGSDNCRLL